MFIYQVESTSLSALLQIRINIKRGKGVFECSFLLKQSSTRIPFFFFCPFIDKNRSSLFSFYALSRHSRFCGESCLFFLLVPFFLVQGRNWRLGVREKVMRSKSVFLSFSWRENSSKYRILLMRPAFSVTFFSL